MKRDADDVAAPRRSIAPAERLLALDRRVIEWRQSWPNRSLPKSNSSFCSAAGEGIDPRPVVKFFTPDAGATWLITEADPADTDYLFGLRPWPWRSMVWRMPTTCFRGGLTTHG
jgi:hypothetical protein